MSGRNVDYVYARFCPNSQHDCYTVYLHGARRYMSGGTYALARQRFCSIYRSFLYGRQALSQDDYVVEIRRWYAENLSRAPVPVSVKVTKKHGTVYTQLPVSFFGKPGYDINNGLRANMQLIWLRNRTVRFDSMADAEVFAQHFPELMVDIINPSKQSDVVSFPVRVNP